MDPKIETSFFFIIKKLKKENAKTCLDLDNVILGPLLLGQVDGFLEEVEVEAGARQRIIISLTTKTFIEGTYEVNSKKKIIYM